MLLKSPFVGIWVSHQIGSLSMKAWNCRQKDPASYMSLRESLGKCIYQKNLYDIINLIMVELELSRTLNGLAARWPDEGEETYAICLLNMLRQSFILYFTLSKECRERREKIPGTRGRMANMLFWWICWASTVSMEQSLEFLDFGGTRTIISIALGFAAASLSLKVTRPILCLRTVLLFQSCPLCNIKRREIQQLINSTNAL